VRFLIILIWILSSCQTNRLDRLEARLYDLDERVDFNDFDFQVDVCQLRFVADQNKKEACTIAAWKLWRTIRNGKEAQEK